MTSNSNIDNATQLQGFKSYFEIQLKKMETTGKKPSSPLSAFCMFSSVMRKVIAQKNPKVTQSKVFKEVSKQWRSCSEKEAYQEIAAKNYKDYKVLLSLWKQRRNGEQPKEKSQVKVEEAEVIFYSNTRVEEPTIRTLAPGEVTSSEEPATKKLSIAQTASDFHTPMLSFETAFETRNLFPVTPATGYACSAAVEESSKFFSNYCGEPLSLIQINQRNHTPSTYINNMQSSTLVTLPSSENDKSTTAEKVAKMEKKTSPHEDEEWDSSRSIWTSSDELEQEEETSVDLWSSHNPAELEQAKRPAIAKEFLEDDQLLSLQSSRLIIRI